MRDPSCLLLGVNSSWLCALRFWPPLQAQVPASPRCQVPPHVGAETASATRRRLRPPPGRSPLCFTHPPSLHVPAVSTSCANNAAKGGGRLCIYYLVSVLWCATWRRFSALTWSAFPPKIMKPLSTKELPPSYGLPGPARGELNPAASSP